MARHLARSGEVIPTAISHPRSGTVSVDASLGVRIPESAADVGRETREQRLTCICGYRDADRRDLSDALRAFALLLHRFPHLRLTVVGTRDRRMEMGVRLHAAALRVSERVDWVADPLLRQAAIGRSTLGFVAADGDDGAYGVLDLMAHGVPFVARRTPITEHYAANGIHGVLLPTLDPAHAASELAAMLSSPERREAMGSAGRTRVGREFTEGAMTQPFDQLVRRLRGKSS